MTDSTALTTTAQAPAAMASKIQLEIQEFELDWRRAKALSMSRMVPPHFQNHAEDCMVAVMMARTLDIDPLRAVQNIHVVNGRPGFDASFTIGLANTRGPFTGPITWTTQGQGEDLSVTAEATIRSTGQTVTSTVSMQIARAEGWTKNPKYRTMPEQMLKYRSATWLIRLHCPEVLMGLQSSEELADVQYVQVKEEPRRSNGRRSTNAVADINQQIKEMAAMVEVSQTAPTSVGAAEQDLSSTPIEGGSGQIDDPFA